MQIVLICILKLIFVSLLSTSSGSSNYYCSMAGESDHGNTNYMLTVNNLPERCKKIAYGKYIFDSDTTPMYKQDESAIQSMVNLNKIVYVYISYKNESNWREILYPSDQHLYDERKAALIKALKDLRISGVIIEAKLSSLYKNSPDSKRISYFINDVKKEIPTLVFGISVVGNELYHCITNGEAPDFTITNYIIDFYVAKLFNIEYQCTQGFGPPNTSTSASEITLDLLCKTFQSSSINMKKTIAHWDIRILTPNNSITTYFKLCDKIVYDWCADNSESLSATGRFIKDYFSRFWVGSLDYDDFDGICQCRKYPATNAVMDGWETGQTKLCSKMDRTNP